MKQLPMWPRFCSKSSDAMHLTLLDAAKALKRVTVDVGYVPHEFEKRRKDANWRAPHAASLLRTGHMQRPTLFKEIFATNDPVEDPKILTAKPGTKVVPIGVVAQAGAKALAGHLAETVVPGMTLSMLHSAGFDSRLVSSMLRRFDVDITFLCWEPEVDAFLKLMAHMGWPSSQLKVLRGGVDFYASALLDFQSVGDLAEPGRFTAGPLLAAQHMPLGQSISAVWADETLGFNATRIPSIADFLAGHLLDSPSPRFSGTWIAPFCSFAWLNVMCTYDIRPFGGDALKMAMLRQVAPDLLDFKNPRFDLAAQVRATGTLPHLALSAETRQTAERLARDCAAAKLVPEFVPAGPAPAAISAYDPWLQSYTKLAMVDRLLKAGVNVVR